MSNEITSTKVVTVEQEAKTITIELSKDFLERTVEKSSMVNNVVSHA